MAKMALGYGSEFHLLRWIGRHRNEFNKKLKECLKIDHLAWLDFEFDKNKTIQDKELVGISFLKNEPIYNEVLANWKIEWPQSGNAMNWDLVGYSDKNKTKTWLLIEAKAHLGELKKCCQAKDKSLNKIRNTLKKVASSYKIEDYNETAWIKSYYQLANRIYNFRFIEAKWY